MSSSAPLALLVIYSVLAVPYLSWRATVVNLDVWFGPVLYVAELYGILSTVLFLWMTRVIIVSRHRPARPSTVDAFICTYNEPLGGAASDAPRSIGLRARRRQPPRGARLAQALGAGYLARGTNEHAKAGNLNH